MKITPEILDKIQPVGVEKHYIYLKEFILNFSPNNVMKGVILVGPPGVGKTLLVYKVAHDLSKETGIKFEVVEYNASYNRNKPFMEELIKQVQSSSIDEYFETSRKIILLDEIDGLEAKSLLIDLLKTTKIPIIMTGNDITKIKNIKKRKGKREEKIEDYAIILYFPMPNQQQLLQVFNTVQEILKINPNEIQGSRFIDFRQIWIGYTQGYTRYDNIFEIVKRMLQQGKYPNYYTKFIGWILLDTLITNTYNNWELAIYLKLLAKCDEYKTLIFLNGIRIINPKITIDWIKRLSQMKQLREELGKEEIEFLGRYHEQKREEETEREESEETNEESEE